MNTNTLEAANNIQSSIIEQQLTPFRCELNKAIYATAEQAACDVTSVSQNPPIRIIPATTGAGKSTFVMGLIAAKYAANKNYTAAFVCRTIEEADKAYRTLKKLISDEDVYIHTSAHSSKNQQEVRLNYSDIVADHATSHRSVKANLSVKRIIVCTHAHWVAEGKLQSDQGVRMYKGEVPRTNVFVDEMPDLCSIEETRPSEMVFLQEHLARVPDWAEACNVVRCIVGRMHDAVSQSGSPFEQASILNADEYSAVSDIDLSILLEVEDTQRLETVRRFLKNASEGKVFLARGHRSGETVASVSQRIAFISYSSNIYPHAGLVILDATAKHSALSTRHPNVMVTPVPNVNFDNLKLTHIQAPDEFKNVARRASKAASDSNYLSWIKKTVTDNTEVGENVLIVAHKRFCDQLPDLKLSLSGRTVHVTHWGTGIGSNEWRHCSSVFLFAELHLPRSVYISTAAAMNAGSLASADLENSRVKETGESFRLHQLKQLGCRGLVREIDADGNAGEMKLFTSMDKGLFIRSFREVFPNAGAPTFIQTELDVQKTKGERLSEILEGYDELGVNLCAVKVAQHLNIKVSEVSTAFKSAKCRVLSAFGWRYVKGERSVSKPMLVKDDQLAPNLANYVPENAPIRATSYRDALILAA